MFKMLLIRINDNNNNNKIVFTFPFIKLTRNVVVLFNCFLQNGEKNHEILKTLNLNFNKTLIFRI